jgi:hypothetical protein
MRYLSIILFLGFLFFLPSCKYFKKGEKVKTTAFMQAQADSIRHVDSLRQVENRLMGQRADSARKAEEERLALTASHKYNIIVGSFLTPEYAKLYADEYRKEGFDPKIIQMEGSKFQLVSAEAFDSFRKAVTRLEQFQDTVQTEAWMYVKKK